MLPHVTSLGSLLWLEAPTKRPLYSGHAPICAFTTALSADGEAALDAVTEATRVVPLATKEVCRPPIVIVRVVPPVTVTKGVPVEVTTSVEPSLTVT